MSRKIKRTPKLSISKIRPEQYSNIPINESDEDENYQNLNYSLKCTTNPINCATIQNYKLLKTIGKGLYSKVKLAASKTHSNKFYAIKIIKRHHVEKISLDIFKKIMLNEVTLLQKLDHPNII